jgi:hypothetical protein
MFANTGVPMLFVQLHLLVLALLPVIAVETWVLGRRLGLPFRRALNGATWANLASTFVGFPLAWLALLGVQLMAGGGEAQGLSTPAGRLYAVTLQAPWLIPYEGDLYWMIPAASLVLLVPCLPASALLEGWLLRLGWADVRPSKVWRAAWLANGLSYTLLLALGGLHLYLALRWGGA